MIELLLLKIENHVGLTLLFFVLVVVKEYLLGGSDDELALPSVPLDVLLVGNRKPALHHWLQRENFKFR